MNLIDRAWQYLGGRPGKSISGRVLHVLAGYPETPLPELSAPGWQVLPLDVNPPDGQLPEGWLDEALKAAARHPGPVLLVASSRSGVLRPEGLTAFEDAAAFAGFGRVELLLLTRDPGARLRSMRSAMLMDPARGYVEYEEMLGDVDDPVQALAWQEAVGRSRRTRLVVRNADRCGERLSGHIEAWLGLPSGTLTADPVPAGRRELTAAEIVFLESVQRSARYPLPPIAAALTEVDPLDPQARLPLEPAFREPLHANIAPAMEAFHANAEPDARFVWDIPDAAVAESRFRYTPRQIEVIAEVYGRHVEAMRQTHREVLDRFNAWLNA
jgi:hypothetical protein